MGIGPLCNHSCRIVFEKNTVTVFSPENDVLLRGWRKKNGAKLWRFALHPKGHIAFPENWSNGSTAMNANDIPSVGALVRYFQTCAILPVCSTWPAAINSINYASWPGLTFDNAAKYCLVLVESLKGYLTQTRQGYCSTKPKQPSEEPLPDITSQLPAIKSQ